MEPRRAQAIRLVILFIRFILLIDDGLLLINDAGLVSLGPFPVCSGDSARPRLRDRILACDACSKAL